MIAAYGPAHTRAVWQALLVTFLWSLSWILIKIGMRDIPALTFAGIRYALAFLILLPLALRGHRAEWQALTRRNWLSLIALGVVYYAITQGAQYVALGNLPATTLTLLLNLTSPLVALLSAWSLRERPASWQWAGITLAVLGSVLYLQPGSIATGTALGFAAGFAALAANSISSIMGRGLNRARAAGPLVITTASMGVGAALLLVAGLATEPLPDFTLPAVVISLWLALVNTAVAFSLWNHTLRTLTATESAAINNTMTVQIALLAWLFLGERMGPWQIAGLAMAVIGAAAVQWRGPRGRAPSPPDPAVPATGRQAGS